MLEYTFVQTFTFGDNLDDTFYCLINTQINPDGLDVSELTQVSPTQVETFLEKKGCILMIDGTDLQQLTGKTEMEGEELHKSLIAIAEQAL